MAVLKTRADFNIDDLRKLAKLFPDIGAGALYHLGLESKILLKKRYLSGQELNLKDMRDRAGKRTISYGLNKRKTAVNLYSYPLNLFERGRTLRSGKREKGKYILTKKLKGDVGSSLQKWVSVYERGKMQRDIDRVMDNE